MMQAVLPARTLFGAHHHFVVLIIALVAVCPILLIGNFRCGFAETRLLPLASASIGLFTLHLAVMSSFLTVQTHEPVSRQLLASLALMSFGL